MASKYLFILFQVVIQPVDLFPHTTHYMTLILFMRVSQPDLLYPHRANMDVYYDKLPPHVSSDLEKNINSNLPTANISVNQNASARYYTGYTNYMQPHLSANKEAGLSEEQKFWLEQMINKDSKQGYR